MPFATAFWPSGFGMVVDRFGTPWMINVSAVLNSAESRMKPNPVVWFEIYVNDLERARKFYETVFQGRLQALPTPEGEATGQGMQMLSFPYPMDDDASASTGDDAAAGGSGSAVLGAGGALVKMEGVSPGGSGTIVYFSCDDCAVEQARVEAAGGRIHKSKFSIGEFGHCALVIDTEGNCIGLHSMQ